MRSLFSIDAITFPSVARNVVLNTEDECNIAVGCIRHHKGYASQCKYWNMAVRSKLFAVFCYGSLAFGALMGLLGVRLLAVAFFWPSAPIRAYLPGLLITLGSSVLPLSIGLMGRYMLANPHTYNARDTVRAKWKQ